MIYVQCLLVLFLLHIIDDFAIQHLTHLNQYKQHLWWVDLVNAEAEKRSYSDRNKEKMWNLVEYDYVVALILHGLKWSIITSLAFICLGPINWWILLALIPINTITHAYIDNLKCNQYKLNLIQDQIAHALQLITTYIIYIGLYLI